uniref:Uncharacterized protein n=1 Tax=Rhizophora mucronata TaxID=61149 RepID=A0A2P2JUL0_RHIMU
MLIVRHDKKYCKKIHLCTYGKSKKDEEISNCTQRTATSAHTPTSTDQKKQKETKTAPFFVTQRPKSELIHPVTQELTYWKIRCISNLSPQSLILQSRQNVLIFTNY